jgi:hypothetical protein
LEKGLDQLALPDSPPPLTDAYTGQGRFVRNTRQLFLC